VARTDYLSVQSNCKAPELDTRRTDASTGLEYLRARYYDADTGAFISRDPVPNPNRYGYADANPIMLTDPSGMCASDKSVAELRAKVDKLESRLGTGKLAEYWRAAWEESYASYAAHACGKSLVCANSPTCAGEGHGCDPTVLNNAATNDHPDACGSCYGPIDWSFLLAYYPVKLIEKECKGLKCKVANFLAKPCVSAAVSFGSGGISLIPIAGPPASALISGFQTGFEAGRGSASSAAANGLSGLTSAATTASQVLDIPGPSNAISAGSSVVSGLPSAAKCLGIT
jgi:RHS repeat-associated protein